MNSIIVPALLNTPTYVELNQKPSETFKNLLAPHSCTSTSPSIVGGGRQKPTLVVT